jgi:hypothetical protein
MNFKLEINYILKVIVCSYYLLIVDIRVFKIFIFKKSIIIIKSLNNALIFTFIILFNNIYSY